MSRTIDIQSRGGGKLPSHFSCGMDDLLFPILLLVASDQDECECRQQRQSRETRQVGEVGKACQGETKEHWKPLT